MAEQEQKQSPEAQPQPPQDDQRASQQQGQENAKDAHEGNSSEAGAGTAAAATTAAVAAPWYARAPIWIVILLLLALLAGLGWLIYQKYNAEKLETARQERNLATLKAYNDAQEEYLKKLRALLQEDPCAIPALLAQIEPPAGTGLPVLPGDGSHDGKAEDAGLSGTQEKSGQTEQSGQTGQSEQSGQSGQNGKSGRSGEPLQIPRDAAPEAAAPATQAKEPATNMSPKHLEAREPANVAELLEQNTVLILALVGKGVSMGTGFFLSPDTIMTNAHVVGNATEVVYINKFVGTVRAASVLLRVREQGLDFAVLKTREPIPVKPLKLQKDLVQKMERVSAWGFPSAVMSDDPKFLGLLQGNMQAAPEVVYTEGSVNVVLNRKPPLVVHSATVSQGNSGGPLVNAAGDVVGINTMIKLDDQSYRQSSLAIPSTVIAAFLEANKVSFTPAKSQGTGGAK